MAQLEAIMTQAIFDHALRIRLKANVADADKQDAAAPASASMQEEAEGEGDVPAAAAATTELEPAKIASDSVSSGSNMIGKINNLITTDMSAMEYANDLLLVGEQPLDCPRTAVQTADVD